MARKRYAISSGIKYPGFSIENSQLPNDEDEPQILLKILKTVSIYLEYLFQTHLTGVVG